MDTIDDNADAFDDIGDLEDNLAIIEEGDVPVATAEPATAGNTGDPLESLYKFHPETILDYSEKVMSMVALQQVPPTTDHIDKFHKSQPFLSVYERTKILGFRANQLAQGARSYLKPVPDHITSTLEIAKLELSQRLLPFIIKRPIPDGTFEYWRLSDLMNI
jgi:DNA-directed RNA polymerase I, II, and III subunit RPABC2